ncbi:hypothetical protein OAR97_02610 [Arcobacteraceae bacterium]|nr:hypothetical protein [Arcobacteraceae bacterium]
MPNIKNELKQVIVKTMIPETEDYLEELHEGYETKTISDEDKETMRDMESFLVELQNILQLVDEDKITDEEAQDVHEKITAMLHESDESNHSS